MLKYEMTAVDLRGIFLCIYKVVTFGNAIFRRI